MRLEPAAQLLRLPQDSTYQDHQMGRKGAKLAQDATKASERLVRTLSDLGKVQHFGELCACSCVNCISVYLFSSDQDSKGASHANDTYTSQSDPLNTG